MKIISTEEKPTLNNKTCSQDIEATTSLILKNSLMILLPIKTSSQKSSFRLINKMDTKSIHSKHIKYNKVLETRCPARVLHNIPVNIRPKNNPID